MKISNVTAILLEFLAFAISGRSYSLLRERFLVIYAGNSVKTLFALPPTYFI